MKYMLNPLSTVLPLEKLITLIFAPYNMFKESKSWDHKEFLFIKIIN